MGKPLLKELPFKIGEQYELNEFNLKALESTFSNGLEYENYEYIKGDFKVLFEIELSSNIILQYNGDVLIGIVFEFNLENLPILLNNLNLYVSLEPTEDIGNHVLGKTFSLFQNQEICIRLDVQKVVYLRVLKILG
tara:strand:- start:3539 stop:3946 length:408 start_codon:yes stop_codon:yes gene_type:complete